MADKYLYNNNGVVTEKESTVTSAGAGDAGERGALNASGKRDSTLLTSIEDYTMTAGENLSAGNVICVIDSTGAKVVKADASSGTVRRAIGFVLDAITSAETGTVHLGNGVITGLSSLTIGATYYLAKTAGGITADVSGYTTGDLVQVIGMAISDTELAFIDNGIAIVLA
jgi:hypothetical protein